MCCSTGCRRAACPGALVEFLVFGLKQAWACLFGGAMLGAHHRAPGCGGRTRRRSPATISCSWQRWSIQIAMLAFKLETLAEAKVILIFHVVGTVMEIFKTSAGSWIYPEESFFRHRRRAAVLRLHVCGRRLLPRPHPAHLRHALPALSAAMGDGRAVRRHLRRTSSPIISCRTCATSCSRRRPRSTGARWSTTASSASATACRCCSASCWWRCSSGSPRTSAPGRAPGSIPDRPTHGRRCRSASSAPGIC